MKKPVVDLRKFRFSKLNTPEFSHLKYLLGWVGYIAGYFLTENLIPVESCHVIHCGLDDVIPFCEFFVIPYTMWYALVVGSLFYFAIYNPDSFKKLQSFIIITQVVAMTIYVIYPNRQDLRPTEFPRDNFLTDIVAGLYAFDTNTNVCPSLHVAYSLAIASVFLKEEDVSRVFKVILVFFVISVCMATAFIKQHSVVDIFAAAAMCLVIEFVLYGKSFYAPKLAATARKK